MDLVPILVDGADEDEIRRRRNEIAGEIRGLRLRAGLSQRAAANLAGVSLSALVSCEGGAVPNRSFVAARLLAALSTEVEAQEVTAA